MHVTVKTSDFSFYQRSLALFAITLVLGLSASPVFAFCPSNGVKCSLGLLVGGIGRSHQDITVDAIKEIYGELFPGVKVSTSMDKALVQIYKANIAVDLDQKTSAKHFDGENFAGAQQFIASNLDLLLSSLNSNDANGARSALGSALHTIQDFYAHSNWIELGNSSPNPNVGRAASISHAALGTNTCSFGLLCDGNNLVGSALTSGYYGGEDATPQAGVRKCYHGGQFDTNTLIFVADGINKDMTNCTISPHEGLHRIAADVAKDATKQFIRDVRARVTPAQLRLLFGVGPTLAICIDTTGSMGSIINGVKAQAISIVDARLGTADEPSKYVLSPFNDPGVGPVTVTTDAAVFKNAINGLSANGGGDCPELSFTGMEQALANADDGAALFVFTDASAKDAAKQLNVTSLAKKKNVQISMGIFGTCSAGSFARVGPPPSGQSSSMFVPAAAATLSSVDGYYSTTALETGGQVFALSASEASNLTKLADTTLRAAAAKLLIISDTFGAAPSSYSVPVDSTMQSITFAVSGTTLANVTLKRPNGATVATGDPDVSLVSLSGGAILSITAPATGAWAITLNGPAGNLFSLNVDGTATLRVASLDFAEENGRPGHAGLFALSGLPAVGVATTIEATMTDGFATVAFAERDSKGAALGPLNLASDPNGSALEFFGAFTPPGGSFVVYATGTDASGKAFQRAVPFVIAPQSVTVTAPPSAILVRGAVNHYQFAVKNLGPSAATFTFTATDDKGFASAPSPSSAALASGESRTLAVDLTVPPAATPGATDTLTVTAASIATNNFAVLMNAVQIVVGPTVTAVSPPSGPPAGGTLITVTGSNFVSGATVSLGGLPALSVTFVDSSTLTALTPTHASGSVDVVVMNPDTQSSTLPGAFTYLSAIPLVSPLALALLVLALSTAALFILRTR